jgi:hypothetical protein
METFARDSTIDTLEAILYVIIDIHTSSHRYFMLNDRLNRVEFSSSDRVMQKILTSKIRPSIQVIKTKRRRSSVSSTLFPEARVFDIESRLGQFFFTLYFFYYLGMWFQIFSQYFFFRGFTATFSVFPNNYTSFSLLNKKTSLQS